MAAHACVEITTEHPTEDPGEHHAASFCQQPQCCTMCVCVCVCGSIFHRAQSLAKINCPDFLSPSENTQILSPSKGSVLHTHTHTHTHTHAHTHTHTLLRHLITPQAPTSSVEPQTSGPEPSANPSSTQGIHKSPCWSDGST